MGQAREGVAFSCEKSPASGQSVVVTNHPLGTAAGLEILAGGGNAVDAAVASLFALTVVEPMMVGIAGGGIAHVRTADGTHHIIDAMSAAPAATHAEIFEPVSDEPARRMETVGRRSAYGPTAVAIPGNLSGWAMLSERFGALPFADLLRPAIRLATNGFAITPYLAGAIGECADDIAADKVMASVFLPGGEPPAAGDTLRQPGYAQALALIAAEGAGALHGGSLGAKLVERIENAGEASGWLSLADLSAFEAVARTPITGTYRGFEVIGPPPPASSGVHVVEMLNMLECADVGALGFGTAAGLDLLIGVMARAMADRASASGDPAFVDVPVARFTSKDYARTCYEALAATPSPAGGVTESPNTTHVTVADKDGMIVSATHTINGIFGARFMVPDACFVPNNYMMNFDPHPGRALSVAPGKRVPTSMAPMIVLRDGRPHCALGLPGGIRIFTSALQGIINLIDHGMSPQEAVEAPRAWTDGHDVELETPLAGVADALRWPRERISIVPHIGGGMGMVAFEPDGARTGAACWRADGTVGALAGGPARPGVRFWPGRRPDPPLKA